MAWALIGDFWQYILGAVAGLGALFAARQSGKKSERLKNAQDNARREAAGRDALQDGRSSGLTPAERMRRNDGHWRGM